MTPFTKIDRPPAAENWSRLQNPQVDRTARNIFNFVRSSPVWNYNPSRKAARFYIEDGISREMGLKVATMKGNPLGHKYNVEVVHAWFDMVAKTPIEGVRAFDRLDERLPIGPGLFVPVKPLTVIREGGQFAPIFFNPWSEIAFDDFQASLYMTALEASIFRLTDFEDSPGRIIFLPKIVCGSGEKHRRPVVWERGQHTLLSQAELNDQIRVFCESKEIARKMYA